MIKNYEKQLKWLDNIQKVAFAIILTQVFIYFFGSIIFLFQGKENNITNSISYWIIVGIGLFLLYFIAKEKANLNDKIKTFIEEKSQEEKQYYIADTYKEKVYSDKSKIIDLTTKIEKFKSNLINLETNIQEGVKNSYSTISSDISNNIINEHKDNNLSEDKISSILNDFKEQWDNDFTSKISTEINNGLNLEPTKVTIEEVLEILKSSSKIEVHTELSKIFSTTFEEVKTQKEKNNSTTSNAKTQTCP